MTDGPQRRRVYFVSLGCPKNLVDTEVMLGVTRSSGHEIVDEPEGADVLVVNTCGFIEPAKEESIDTILELADIKRKARGQPTLVVAGCLSQRHPTELAQELPEVDHFLGSADMLGLGRVLSGGAPRMGVSALDQRAYLYDHDTPRLLSGRGHVAYVKIAEGCDRPCAFCIIPKLRGPQRSRTVFSVVEEVAALARSGTREICLIAQDSTAYGRDLEPSTDLEQLLDSLVRIEGIEWIRIHYAYPSAVSTGLLHRIAQEPKIATYLDVPIQHIDTGVLKVMRRGYTERSIHELIANVRDPSIVGDAKIWLRTTLLVGHPGETQDAFARLREFVAHGEIDHLGVFPWSREDGTVSALQPRRVPESVATDRAAELMELQASIRERTHRALFGQRMRVMVDGASEDSDLLLEGRHEGQSPGIDGKVVLTDGTASVGDIVEATVTQTDAHDLVATLDQAVHRDLVAT